MERRAKMYYTLALKLKVTIQRKKSIQRWRCLAEDLKGSGITRSSRWRSFLRNSVGGMTPLSPFSPRYLFMRSGEKSARFLLCRAKWTQPLWLSSTQGIKRRFALVAVAGECNKKWERNMDRKIRNLERFMLTDVLEVRRIYRLGAPWSYVARPLCRGSDLACKCKQTIDHPGSWKER